MVTLIFLRGMHGLTYSLYEPRALKASIGLIYEVSLEGCIHPIRFWVHLCVSVGHTGHVITIGISVCFSGNPTPGAINKVVQE